MNRQSNYEAIMADYEKRRMAHQYEFDQKKAALYEKVPKIKEIDETIASISIQQAREALMGKAADSKTVANRIDTLLHQKKALLLEYNYPADYLEPVYTCKACKDTGYVGQEKCSCFQQAIIDSLYAQSNMQRILQGENFETFSLAYYSMETDGTHPYSPYDNMKHILERTKAFINDFDIKHENMLLHGETGLGKTFLSNCIAKALLDKGHTVLYLTAGTLFESVFSDVLMNKNRHQDSQDTYDYVYDCELLIIDDLGTEFSNSFTNSQLYQCLNERLLRNKSTIISTNLTLKELRDRYSERILSRMIENYIIFDVYGDNIRYQKRKNAIQKG